MKVYVAGKTQDRQNIQVVQNLASALGHEVTHDWTKIVNEWGGDASEVDIPEERLQDYAQWDMQGVYLADLVIAVGHPRLTGTLWECGGAAILRKPLWLVGWEKARYSIFEHLPNVQRVETISLAQRLWECSPVRHERQVPPIMEQKDDILQVAVCTCGQPARHVKGGFLCCKHYVDSGGIPIGYHVDCVAQARIRGLTQLIGQVFPNAQTH